MVGEDREDEAGAIPQDQGGLGQAQGAAVADQDPPPGEHAGPRRAAGGQVDVDQAEAGMGIQGRGWDPDLAGHPLAPRQLDPGRLPRLDPGELLGGDLRPPLDPPLADEAKQLGPRLDDHAQGRPAGGNDAIVHRQHPGLAETDTLLLQGRLRRRQVGLGRLLGQQILGDQLLGHGALVLDVAGAIAVGPGLRQGSANLGHLGLLLGQLGLDRVFLQAGQDLVLAHRVTDIRQDLDHLQASGLRGDHPFLPGEKAAAGLDLQGPVGHFRDHQVDGQGRTGRGAGASAGANARGGAGAGAAGA